MKYYLIKTNEQPTNAGGTKESFFIDNDVVDVIYEFADSKDFNDKLYDNTGFEVIRNYDDKDYIEITDAPNPEWFEEDLIEWVEEQYGVELNEQDEQELVQEWNKHWNTIFSNCEERLIDKYRDYLSGDYYD